jgi:nitrogen fixation-related uncharacterized protein
MHMSRLQALLGRYSKDYYGGALMIVIGLCAIRGGVTYHIGTLAKMDSGFFPVSLGILLVLIGIAIAAGARTAVAPSGKKQLPAEWRGWLCILSGILAFVVLGQYGGLLPATFAITFISALGDRQNTLKTALLLAVAMCAISVAVFWWALAVQFPLFQWGAQ